MKKLSAFLAATLVACSTVWYLKAALAEEATPTPAVPEAATPKAPETPAPAAGDGLPAPTVSKPDAAPTAVAPAVTPAAAATAGEAPDVVKKDGDIAGATASRSTANTNLISISLDDVEMVDVVRMFTKISGANILSTPTNLRGRVTVNLNEVEWKPALESILDMHNLTLKEKLPGSGVYSIIVKPVGQPDPQFVETVFLKYAKVDKVQPVIQAMLVPGGMVSPFTSKNAFVIRSTQANLNEIKQIVDKIDKLRDQVFIETKFMELNDSAIKDLGVDWSVLKEYNARVGSMSWNLNQQRKWNTTDTKTMTQWDRRNNIDTMNQTYDLDGIPSGDNTRRVADTINTGKEVDSKLTDSFTKDLTDIRTAVLSADEFRIMLSALNQMNGVTVVSNPKIIVANEESALIHIGETQKPFEATVTPATQTTAPFTTYKPGQPIDLGVKLTVTPTVNTSNSITVAIEPQLTRFVRDDIAPDGATKYPIVTTKNIKTLFCLESGKTVAIGGLTETKDSEVEKKVPLLGDIPIIGKYLFTHSHTEKAQQETIIFVTVSLAMPENIQKTDGYPEDTELARREVLRSEVKKRQIEADSQEMEKAVQENDSKVKARLLKRRT